MSTYGRIGGYCPEWRKRYEARKRLAKLGRSLLPLRNFGISVDECDWAMMQLRHAKVKDERSANLTFEE